MKYCDKCGKQLNDGANFCSNCGAVLDGVHQTVETYLPNYSAPLYDPDYCPENERKTGGFARPVLEFGLAVFFFWLGLISHKTIMMYILGIITVICMISAVFAPKQRNYCANCFKRKAPNAKACPHCGHRDVPALPAYVSLPALVGLFIVFGIIIANNI